MGGTGCGTIGSCSGGVRPCSVNLESSFLPMGRAGFPPCSLALGQMKVGCGLPPPKGLSSSPCLPRRQLSVSDPEAGCWQLGHPLETPKHLQASLAQSPWAHSSFLLVLVSTGLICASRSRLSPGLWMFCDETPRTCKVRFPGDSQSLCGTPVWECVVGLRTFASARTSLA